MAHAAYTLDVISGNVCLRVCFLFLFLSRPIGVPINYTNKVQIKQKKETQKYPCFRINFGVNALKIVIL